MEGQIDETINNEPWVLLPPTASLIRKRLETQPMPKIPINASNRDRYQFSPEFQENNARFLMLLLGDEAKVVGHNESHHPV